MNIKDTWPTRSEPYDLTPSHIQEIMARRLKTAEGFSAIEAEKGFLKPHADFSTPKGQEMFRILIFRAIEELAESSMSEDVEHKKEELIDSFNYFLTALQLDRAIPGENAIRNELWHSLKLARFVNDPTLSSSAMWKVVETIAGELTDTFRNRAWMQNPQDHYFAGSEACLSSLRTLVIYYMRAFKDFDEFYRFFIAKDEVLQFRLQSAY